MPCCGRPSRARAHEAEDVIREMRVRGPDLRAVHDVVVAVAHGARLQAREIRTRSGFRIALTPVVLAGEHLRQVTRLLFIARVCEQRGRQQVRTLIEHARRAGARALLAEDEQLCGRPAGAAVLRRANAPRPSRGDSTSAARSARSVCRRTCRTSGGSHRSRSSVNSASQEFANLTAKSFVFRAEADIERHRCLVRDR